MKFKISLVTSDGVLTSDNKVFLHNIKSVFHYLWVSNFLVQTWSYRVLTYSTAAAYSTGEGALNSLVFTYNCVPELQCTVVSAKTLFTYRSATDLIALRVSFYRIVYLENMNYQLYVFRGLLPTINNFLVADLAESYSFFNLMLRSSSILPSVGLSLPATFLPITETPGFLSYHLTQPLPRVLLKYRGFSFCGGFNEFQPVFAQ
jgi:hypothetical protein